MTGTNFFKDISFLFVCPLLFYMIQKSNKSQASLPILRKEYRRVTIGNWFNAFSRVCDKSSLSKLYLFVSWHVTLVASRCFKPNFSHNINERKSLGRHFEDHLGITVCVFQTSSNTRFLSSNCTDQHHKEINTADWLRIKNTNCG